MDKTVPIWITNWVIGYTGGRGKKVEHYSIQRVIAKGKDEKAILENKYYLRKADWAHEQSKKESKVSRKHINDVADKYIAISVQLIKQVGYGVADEE